MTTPARDQKTSRKSATADRPADPRAKVERPHAHFDNPAEVIVDPDLSREQKQHALDQLEQDAQQLAVASNEGMDHGEPTHLRSAKVAQDALDHPAADRTLLAAEQYLNALLPKMAGTDTHALLRKAIDALNDARSAIGETEQEHEEISGR